MKASHKLVEAIIGALAIGLILKWYLWIFTKYTVPYLALCICGLIVSMIIRSDKRLQWISQILGLIFLVAAICQILYWFNVVTFPLIK